MKNLKKIANDLQLVIKDPNFEDFITEQILSIKSSYVEEPFFSIIHKNLIFDVWKNGNSFELIKSVIPTLDICKKTGKDFRKTISKKELINEINKIILNEFLE